MLNQQIKEDVEIVPRRRKDKLDSKKKGRNAKAKSGFNIESVVTNEIEEKKQEIKEISEDINENMKYLVENKYNLQLKKQRKKKGIQLEADQQDKIAKYLEISKFITVVFLKRIPIGSIIYI